MVPTPGGTLGQTKEVWEGGYPRGTAPDLQVLMRLTTDLVVVGLKALLEAAWGAETHYFWPQLPRVPVLGGNGERKEAGWWPLATSLS